MFAIDTSAASRLSRGSRSLILCLVRPMRRSLAILVGLAVLTGCTKETWSRAELVDWYLQFGSKRPKLGYAGSDGQYHYFATRPIDNWVLPRVARTEITIAEERSHASLGRRFWFYVVDPAQDFAKIPNSDVPE